METMSIKALAIKALEGNHEGNQQETKSFPMRKPEGKPSKSFPVELPRVGNQETPRSKPVKATGYGCAGCGNKNYTQQEIWTSHRLPEGAWGWEHSLVKGWRCEGCGSEYLYIGGSTGPQAIN
jgi:hypothetical protein